MMNDHNEQPIATNNVQVKAEVTVGVSGIRYICDSAQKLLSAPTIHNGIPILF